jgi:hypothetical protein
MTNSAMIAPPIIQPVLTLMMFVLQMKRHSDYHAALHLGITSPGCDPENGHGAGTTFATKRRIASGDAVIISSSSDRRENCETLPPAGFLRFTIAGNQIDPLELWLPDGTASQRRPA